MSYGRSNSAFAEFAGAVTAADPKGISLPG